MSDRPDTSIFGDDSYDYTEQELANLALVRTYRAARIADRKHFLAPGFRRRRMGLQHINETWPPGDSFVPVESSPGGDPVAGGMDDKSIADRTNVLTHLCAKGNIVWGVFHVHGHHTGYIAGLPATQRPVDLMEVAMWRISGGKITDAWYFGDELGLLQQVGAAVTLPDAAQDLGAQ